MLKAWRKLIPVPQPDHSGVERGNVNGNSSRVGSTSLVPAHCATYFSVGS
jgi:hypothetical protein